MTKPTLPFGRARLPLVLALAGLHGLVQAWSFRFNNVDDAYIAFRYGWNLVAGHGLVFNPGERVEGYTSILWTLLLAPCTHAGIDIAWFSIPLGLAASLATIWGLDAHVRLQVRRGASPWLAAALLLLALDGSHAFWAVAGLETALFTALIVWSTWAALAWRGWRGALGCGLLLGLATLTRPEGGLVAVLVVAHRAFARHPQARREAGWMMAAAALLVLPHLVWRHAYYGAWLPNTFHNKVSWEPAAWSTGAAYSARLVLWRWGEPLLALLVPLRREAAHRFSLHLLLVGAWVVYVTAVGGDWPIANRFFVPILPFLHLLCVQALVDRVRPLGLRRAGLAGALAAVLAGTHLHAESFGMVRRHDNVGVETQRKRFGVWLRRELPAGTLIATGAAGAIPYYSRLPTLDLWGLTDPHIARVPRFRFQPGHDRTDLPYVLGRQPQLIIGTAGFPAARPPAGYALLDGIPEAVRPREVVYARRQARP
jgi:arabinofuranosyltransferase